MTDKNINDFIDRFCKIVEMKGTGMSPDNNFLSNCTRVEVIDKSGRAYVNRSASNKVQLSLQDNDRTLKIFITN